MTLADLQYCIYCNQKVMLYILKVNSELFCISHTAANHAQKTFLEKAISIFLFKLTLVSHP